MDFYDDFGTHLVKMFNVTSVPDFVKQGTYDADGVEGLPDCAFADKASRKFPVHTPSDVFVSAAYAYGKQASPSQDVATELQKAASLFGITSEVNSVIEQAKDFYNSSNKVAEGPRQWSFSTKFAEFSGSGSEQVQLAASRFINNLSDYPVGDRSNVALNLQKIASEFGTELPGEIEQIAGDSHIDLSKLAMHLEARALFLHDKRDVAGFLEKIAHLKTLDSMSKEDGLEMVQFVDTFDKQAELSKFYGEKLNNPHATVFNTPMSEHLQKTATVKIGSVTHKWYDLRQVSGDVFAEVLGRKIADVKELESVNDEEARLLNQILL